MAYAFFLSYASADGRRAGKVVEWFFNTLDDRLKFVHGETDVGEGGYLAPVAIREGQDWRDALPAALNRSRVLVCLQSPNYFNSEYCGKELEVFLRRRRYFAEKRGGEPPDCIIQVTLQPNPARPAPRTVPDFQRKNPDGSLFPVDAVGLYQTYEKKRATGKDFIFNLAMRISNLLTMNVNDNELPPLPYTPELDGVPSAFESPALPLPPLEQVKAAGPRSVTFVYSSALTANEWPFSPPPEDAAVIRAAAVARSREYAIQGIEFGPDTSDFVAKIEHAQQLNTPVILMLTPKNLSDTVLVDRCSAIKPDGVATVVVDRDAGSVAPDLLKTLRTVDRFHTGLNTPDLLEKAVRRSLAVLRQKLGHEGRSAIDGAKGPSTLPLL